MPSAFTHIFIGEALGKTYTAENMPKKFWVLAGVCSIIPDIDIIGYNFGIKYAGMFGHRGFFHSLVFALIVSVLVVKIAFRTTPRFTRQWWSLSVFFFVVTAAHGFFDSMTDKGMGVGFFIPFDQTRYHMPWRPIYASPMSISRFFGRAGIEVLITEILWIWLPMTALAAGVSVYRRMIKSRSPS
jgi:inner membrane protein